LYKYKNGNYTVEIYKDGTKIRSWDCSEIPRVEFPESVDLKITDHCTGGCEFCHENSSLQGKHANKKDIYNILQDLPQGVEIAIGGGDPLSHPHIIEIVSTLSTWGLVVNITASLDSALQNINKINYMRKDGMSHGLGLSQVGGSSNIIHQLCPSLIDKNTVFHTIAGIDNPCDLATHPPDLDNNKILILGYKNIGRGKQYYTQKVEDNLRGWRYWLPAILSRGWYHISFDNLAIEQLGVKELVSPELWSESYMGNDGEFTMYVDAVKMEYAESSISDRFPLNGMGVCEAFRKIERRSNL